MTKVVTMAEAVTAVIDKFLLDGWLPPMSPLEARRLSSAIIYEVNEYLLSQGCEIRRKEAVPGGTVCQSLEHAVPETTTNDAQPS